MNTPSADALRLAVILSGHTHCQRGVERNIPGETPCCDGCLGDARTIDKELQLPHRNVALFKAQAVCDEDARCVNLTDSKQLIDELRDSLARIQ